MVYVYVFVCISADLQMYVRMNMCAETCEGIDKEAMHEPEQSFNDFVTVHFAGLQRSGIGQSVTCRCGLDLNSS